MNGNRVIWYLVAVVAVGGLVAIVTLSSRPVARSTESLQERRPRMELVGPELNVRTGNRTASDAASKVIRYRASTAVMNPTITPLNIWKRHF